MDYTNTFTQLGAELKNARTIEALLIRFRDSDDATYASRLISAAYSVSVDEEDNAISIDKAFFKGGVVGDLKGLHGSAMSTFESAFFPVLGQELDIDDIEAAKGAIGYDYDTVLQATGQIVITRRRGYWGSLYNQMVDDSETIRKNVLSFGAFTPGPANVGLLAVAGSPTFAGMDHTLSGVIRWTCTSQNVDKPQLSCQLELTKPLPDGTTVIVADNPVTPGFSFEDGQTGLSFEIDLDAMTKSGDAGGPIFSSETFTLPSANDTNLGIFYIKVTRQASGPTWLIEWFNNSDTSNPLNLVQRKTINGAAGTVTGQVMLRNSVFSFSFNKTNAAADMPAATNTRTVTYDIHTPREGDFWTKTVTNDETGNFATKLAHRYRASLNSVANPGQTISDALAASLSVS